MKIAYSNRDGDEDTFIVRDLDSGKRFDRFSVYGTGQLKQVFYTMLNVLKAQKNDATENFRG